MMDDWSVDPDPVDRPQKPMDEPTLRHYKQMTTRALIAVMFALVVLWILVDVAFSAPPVGANPDSPLATWYRSLQVPNSNGAGCCSLADCREVVYRSAGDHFEAFVDRKTFGEEAPNAWVRVPEQSRLRPMTNPTGSGVLCFYQGEVRCFVEATGT